MTGPTSCPEESDLARGQGHATVNRLQAQPLADFREKPPPPFFHLHPLNPCYWTCSPQTARVPWNLRNKESQAPLQTGSD